MAHVTCLIQVGFSFPYNFMEMQNLEVRRKINAEWSLKLLKLAEAQSLSTGSYLSICHPQDLSWGGAKKNLNLTTEETYFVTLHEEKFVTFNIQNVISKKEIILHRLHYSYNLIALMLQAKDYWGLRIKLSFVFQVIYHGRQSRFSTGRPRTHLIVRSNLFVVHNVLVACTYCNDIFK